MSFIPTGDSENDGGRTVANIDFYPDIESLQFRTLYRVDTTIDNDRISDALRNAIISTNRDLAEWCSAHKLDGIANIVDIDADRYDGVSELVTHYLTAIYSKAKAELLEKYRDFDSTGSGHGRGDELTTTMDDHRANALRAIRAITKSEWAGLI